MPSMTVQSAAIRRLRREHEAARMKTALAPAGSVAKKPAAAEPLVAAEIKKNLSHASFCVGTKVRVRTPTRLLRPGRYLVFWLHAVVVDAGEEDGHIKVVYCDCDYEHPDSDPTGVVRVLKKDVKNMVQRAAASAGTGSSDVTTSHSAAANSSSSQGQGDYAPLRRPTTGGKTPSVLKKIEEAMPLIESEDSLDSISW